MNITNSIADLGQRMDQMQQVGSIDLLEFKNLPIDHLSLTTGSISPTTGHTAEMTQMVHSSAKFETSYSLCVTRRKTNQSCQSEKSRVKSRRSAVDQPMPVRCMTFGKGYGLEITPSL